MMISEATTFAARSASSLSVIFVPAASTSARLILRLSVFSVSKEIMYCKKGNSPLPFQILSKQPGHRFSITSSYRTLFSPSSISIILISPFFNRYAVSDSLFAVFPRTDIAPILRQARKQTTHSTEFFPQIST